MDFEGTFTTIRIAQVELDRLEFAAAVKNGIISAGVANIIHACTPICTRAVEIYNMTPVLHLLIPPQNIHISIDPKTKSLSLVVRMHYPSGHEPDGDLDSDEVQQVQSALQPLIDMKLQDAGIPLTFVSLHVPNGYHMK